VTPRRAIGVLHLLAAAFLLVTLVTQVVDLAAHDALEPAEYFASFTIDTTILEIALLALTGWSAITRSRDDVLLTAAALAVVPYAMVTGIVYNVTLRGLPPEGYQAVGWPNEVMHVAVPVLLVVDWFLLRLLDAGRPALPWWSVWLALGFPSVWILLTMLRGAVTGWYPYPFLEPDNPDGVVGIAAYIGGIAVFVAIVTAFGVLVSRARVSAGRAGTR
jgi:hypothetical protein